MTQPVELPKNKKLIATAKFNTTPKSDTKQIEVKAFDLYRRFFKNMPIYRDVASQLNVPVNFVVAHSAGESGWLNDHNFQLNNLFGLTHAGGKNQSFATPEDSGTAYIKAVDHKVHGVKTWEDYIAGLQKENPYKYNSVNPNYASDIHKMLPTTERYEKKYGVTP